MSGMMPLEFTAAAEIWNLFFRVPEDMVTLSVVVKPLWK